MAKITKEEKLKLTGFNDMALRAVLIPLFAFFYPILVFGIWPNETPLEFAICFFIGFVYIFIFWAIDYRIVLTVRKRFQGFENHKKRLVMTGVFLMISTVVLTVLSHIPDLVNDDLQYRAKTPFFIRLMASIIITVIIVSIYEGWYNFAQFKDGMIKNEELKKESAQAQLAALQNQVNPHFLFNSLNTLISVIPEDQETAVSFAENLSKVYRYLLEIRDKEIISLKDELNCIRAYDYLLKIRFGDGIEILYPNENECYNKHIIPLSIQMLLENAVKHNIVSQKNPLSIKIIIEGESLKVSNNLQLKKVHQASTKVGLVNIQKRYDLLMEKKVEIVETETDFQVIIPLVKMNVIK
ncbi:MAG: histidine kinase [Crocinitomicaceae bacterium]|nr:histidine kinase [Crocinitomicaceae bacterium]